MIVDFFAKIHVFIVSHHEKVALQLLLLGGIELALLRLAALVIFPVAFVIKVLVLLRMEVLLNSLGVPLSAELLLPEVNCRWTSFDLSVHGGFLSVSELSSGCGLLE